MKKVQENAKKSECSLCKSENPLYKKIPSEKNLLLVEFRIQLLEVPGTHGTKADGATELKSLKCQQLYPLACLKISLTSFLITLNGVLNQFSNHLKQYFQSKIAKEYYSHQNSNLNIKCLFFKEFSNTKCHNMI